MNHFTSFVDIAGRVTQISEVFHRVTSAAVVISTADLARVRSSLPHERRKWGESDSALASTMADLMLDHAVAVGAFSVNKRTPAWDKFWADSLAIEQKIRKQDGRPAGFVRAANQLRFHLMGSSASVAFGHAHFRTQSKQRVVDYMGRDLISNDIVFDTDIQGAENEDMLRHILNIPMSRCEKHFNFTLTRNVLLKTEQDEPLLLLADFAAGLVHAALLPEAHKHLPVCQEEATNILQKLHDAGILAIHQSDFNADCRDVFGDLADTSSLLQRPLPRPLEHQEQGE